MKALDQIALRQTVIHLQNQITQQLAGALEERLFESTPQQMVAECNAFLGHVKDSRIVDNVNAIDSRIVTQYEIHDAKNRCFVRLMDENDGDIKFIWLRGRRKAHKVGRAQIGSLYLAFSAMPVVAERRITFQVSVQRPPLKKGLAGA